MMWKLLGLAVLLYVVHHGRGETGCPEAEDIQPCGCTQTPYTYLLCENITDADVLRNVFSKSERYTYKEVHIKYSVMQYLPAEMFETTEVHEIYLKNVTLTNLFDRAPDALDKLRTLHIENCRVQIGILWEILKPLKSLKILNVYYNSIRTLGKEFSEYAPIGLEQLALYATETRTIKPGTFTNFTSLEKIAVDAGKLTTLTRDIFPTPFNGKYLYFNYNKITSIPAGLFSEMPNLQTVGLRENQLATLSQEAFDSQDSVAKLTYLWLEGNPLKCDCNLVWLMDVKPTDLTGKCTAPKKLEGRDLKDLVRTDFNC